jgi:hypothetical protein
LEIVEFAASAECSAVRDFATPVLHYFKAVRARATGIRFDLSGFLQT